MRRVLLCLTLVAVVGGCQRPWYRRDADRETYGVEREHENEWLWPVARTNITPPPGSRLFDPFNPDYPPLPPDDPAAFSYMLRPDGQPAPRTYFRDGVANWIEDPAWWETLELDKDGNLVLAPDKAVELGLLHSRDYQQALEDLYSTSLRLTLNRWEFALQWFGTNDTTFSHFGAGPTEVNTLNTTSNIGFSRNFAAGGQLLVDFANTFVFSYSGTNQMFATSNLAASLTQPLLRGAGRRVRLEGLTQAERNVLYSVREFARFRKQFYVALVTSGGSGYLGLLRQVQNIRNLESNLKSQEQNLRLHEALYARGIVSSVQVDQAFQSYQQGRFSLIQAQAALQTSLDSYKISLGLPPVLQVKLDDSILQPFQLASPELEKLQGDLEQLFAEYRELDQAPPVDNLRSGFSRMTKLHRMVGQLTDGVEGELKRWENQQPAPWDEPAQVKREQATRAALQRQVPELRVELAKLAKDLADDEGALAEPTRVKSWEILQKRARQLIASAGQLYIIQTQVRVYLIQLEPIPFALNDARAYARENRLDLMNQRGKVVDSWRKIEVAANALKAGLDITATANLATPPAGNNPFDFRATASQYTVGLAFDGPLNRLAERNIYRSSLIAYQQSRRSFMALDDQIQAAVALDVRQLEAERANFSIARQSLIAAARQVEGARDRLLVLPNAAETTGTQDVLNALNALLTAKSTLIGSWINYQSNRAQLLLDTDALRLDDQGFPENESGNTRATVQLGTPFPLEQLPQPRLAPDKQAGK